MRRRVDLLQLHDRHLGVDLCRREFRVSEEHLDEADVGAVFQHVRRTGMAEQVTRAGHPQSRMKGKRWGQASILFV